MESCISHQYPHGNQENDKDYNHHCTAPHTSESTDAKTVDPGLEASLGAESSLSNNPNA